MVKHTVLHFVSSLFLLASSLEQLKVMTNQLNTTVIYRKRRCWVLYWVPSLYFLCVWKSVIYKVSALIYDYLQITS